LIVFSLSLPLLIDQTGTITRENSYELMSEEHGAYSFIRSEIFDGHDEIDVLLIGSSIQWNAVDTPQIQQVLSEATGRKAKVVSFGFNFNGIDIPYAMLRDVLERKRVRLVIFSIPRLPFNDGPNATAYRFLRFGEYPDATDRLPGKYRAALYAGSVLRSPHDLLTLLRENRSNPSKFASDLGANKEFLGMERDPAKFVKFTPASPAFSSYEISHSKDNQDQYYFTNEELPAYQDHYLTELIALLRSKNVPLAMLNVPQYNERRDTRVTERFDFEARFRSPIPLIGVAPSRLFGGLSPDEIELLHCDRYHFNANGSEYFTRAILPAIVEVYKTHAAK
jgi:hypothetical protein